MYLRAFAILLYDFLFTHLFSNALTHTQMCAYTLHCFLRDTFSIGKGHNKTPFYFVVFTTFVVFSTTFVVGITFLGQKQQQTLTVRQKNNKLINIFDSAMEV